MIDFQKRMKKILKLSTLKSSAHLDIHWLREEHDEALSEKNDTKEI